MSQLAPEKYPGYPLLERDVHASPFAQFAMWYNDAIQAKIPRPDTMALATSGSDGKPSVRFILLKQYGEQGFVFYTNYQSRKAKEFIEKPLGQLSILLARIFQTGSNRWKRSRKSLTVNPTKTSTTALSMASSQSGLQGRAKP